MKKIVSLLIIISVALSMAIMPAYAEDYTSFKDNVNMLTGFGFIKTSGGSAGSEVKRSEFYGIICELIHFETPEQLAEMAIAVTDKSGNIPQPNKPITYDEALITGVKVLGQGLGLTTADDFLSRAYLLGLTDGLNGGEVLSRADMMQLMVNICKADVVQIIDIKGGNFVYSSDGKVDLLEKYHNIKKIKGIVYEASGKTVTTEQNVSSEYVRINDEIFMGGSAKAEKYLGCTVEAYYRDNTPDPGELLYIAGTNKNEVITVRAEDIIEEDTTRYEVVYEKSGTEKKAKISKVADMVYNGRGYPDFTASEMIPNTGDITLIDNNGDRVFDCIIVNSYETVVVDRASATYDRITGKNEKVIELSEYYDYKVYYENNEITLGGILSWDIVYIMADKEKENAVLYVTRNSFEGAVTSFNKNDEVIGINGKEYRINPEFFHEAEKEQFECFRLGKTKLWYLDGDGRVATYKNIMPGANNYGWFLKPLVDEDTETVTLKILTVEGEWVIYSLPEKVKIDGVLYSQNKISKVLSSKQIIRYTLNEKEEIKSIETATTVTEGDDSDAFRRMNVSGTYRTEDYSFSSKYYMNAETIFSVPEGYDENGNEFADDEDLYSVGNWSYPDYTSYNLEFYDPDKNNCSSVIVYRTSPASVSTSKSPVFVVSEVADVLIGGEPVQQMRGVLRGHSIQLNAEEYGLFNEINSGDTVQYALNSEGRVSKISFVYKANSDEKVDDVLGAELHTSDGIVLKARVVHVDADNKFIKVEGSTGSRVLKTNNTSFSIYNRKEKKAQKANASDIEPGDFVMLYARSSKLYDICVYKEE